MDRAALADFPRRRQDQSQALLVFTAPRGSEGYEKIQLLGVLGQQTFAGSGHQGG